MFRSGSTLALLVLLVLAAVLAAGAPRALALEKTSRCVIDPDDSWSTSTTGTLRYYNNCTGWVWVWSGWSAGERMGVRFDLACAYPFFYLNATWALTFSGIPSGYGFTGTISVRDGFDCAASVLASQPYLPPVTSGWNATLWGGVPLSRQFLVDVTWAAQSGYTNGTGLASDHPQAGPTGPAACGVCFPTTRVSHSRYFGVGGAYCPSGITLNDGLCDIEWMIDADPRCVDVVVDDSWAKVKSLYR